MAIEVKRHELLDSMLRDRATRIAEDFFAFVSLAAQAVEEKVHEYFGFLGVDAYFEERLGLSARTMHRYLAIHRGVQALPEPERPDALQALARVKMVKAAILAPALKKEPANWRGWVEVAEHANVRDLQERVSTATGAPRRSGATHSDFRAVLQKWTPPEAWERIETILNRALRDGDATNDVGVYLLAFDCLERDQVQQLPEAA